MHVLVLAVEAKAYDSLEERISWAGGRSVVLV